jgi:hypothetical protein
LAGKKVVSNELGAMPGRPYSQLLTELLFSADAAFTANTNKFVLHGQPYSGNYYNTTWPGYTPFQYGFSELYSPRQPAWEHGLDEVLGYLGRAQHSMQMGVANLDIAIYNKVAKTDPLWTYNVYAENDLERASELMLNRYRYPRLTLLKRLHLCLRHSSKLQASASLRR